MHLVKHCPRIAKVDDCDVGIPYVSRGPAPSSMPMPEEMAMIRRCVWSFFSRVTLASHFLRGVWKSKTYDPSCIFNVYVYSDSKIMQGIKINLKTGCLLQFLYTLHN